MVKGIYKLYSDWGRHGTVCGIFVADSADVEKIMGKKIYFGEILGKHSEVVEEMTPETLYLVTRDPIAVEIFERYGFASGYNPFDYIEEFYCEKSETCEHYSEEKCVFIDEDEMWDRIEECYEGPDDDM